MAESSGQVNSFNLLRLPQESTEQVAANNNGGQQQQQRRRKSTLSGNGYFIDRSCTRRRSSAAQHRNQALSSYLSPVRFAPAAAASGSPASRRLSQPPPAKSHATGLHPPYSRSARAGSYSATAVHHQHQPPALQLAGSGGGGIGCQPMQLLLPVRAPSALAGSRKTSIFDPSGHSIAPHLLIGARRKSTMVASAAASGAATTVPPAELGWQAAGAAAEQAMLPSGAEQTMLSVARQAAAKSGKPGGKSERVRHVPVIGCSPTSIKASLAALDETRRYEKLLRRLKRHQERKVKRLGGHHHQVHGQEDDSAAAAAATSGLRRKSLRAISHAASSVLSRAQASFGARRHEDRGADGLSVSSASLANSSSSSSSLANSVTDEQLRLYEMNECEFYGDADFEDGDHDDDDGNNCDARRADLDERLTATGGGDKLAAANSGRADSVTHGDKSKRSSLVRSAMKKLASTISTGSSLGASKGLRGGGCSAPKANRRSMSVAGGMNYWYYYYYLRENSIDPIDDFPTSCATGASAEAENRARLHINYSLARIDILNSKFRADPSPQPAAETRELDQGSCGTSGACGGAAATNTSSAGAYHLMTGAGGEQQAAAGSPSQFDYSNQSTDVSLTLSSTSAVTTTSSPSSERSPSPAPSARSSFDCNADDDDENSLSAGSRRGYRSRPQSPSRRSASAEPQPQPSGHGRRQQSARSSLCSAASSGGGGGAASADDERTSATDLEQAAGSRALHNHLSLSSRSTARSPSAAPDWQPRQHPDSSTARQKWPSAALSQRKSAPGDSARVWQQQQQSTATAAVAAGELDNEEELDDFERLSRCHRNYKELVAASRQQSSCSGKLSSPAAVIKSRHSSVRLSVKSARVAASCSSNINSNCASPKGASVNRHLGAASARTSAGAGGRRRESSRISLSWDTLASPEPADGPAAAAPQVSSHPRRSHAPAIETMSDAAAAAGHRRSFKVQRSSLAAKVTASGLTNNSDTQGWLQQQQQHPPLSPSLTGAGRDPARKDGLATSSGGGGGNVYANHHHEDGADQLRNYAAASQHQQSPYHSTADCRAGRETPQTLASSWDTTSSLTMANMLLVAGEPPASYHYDADADEGPQQVGGERAGGLIAASSAAAAATGLELQQQQQQQQQQEGRDAGNGMDLSSLHGGDTGTCVMNNTANNNTDNNTTFIMDEQSCSICSASAAMSLQRDYEPLEGNRGRLDESTNLDSQYRARHGSAEPIYMASRCRETGSMRLIRSDQAGEADGAQLAQQQQQHGRDHVGELRARAHSTGTGSGGSIHRPHQQHQQHPASVRIHVREAKSSLLRESVSNQLDFSGACLAGGDSMGSAASHERQFASSACTHPTTPGGHRDDTASATSQLLERQQHRQVYDKEMGRKKSVLDKSSFNCMLLGARQTGKRTIVKCFVKLLNEFQLAAAEYKREKLLAKLMDCSERLQRIMGDDQQEQEAEWSSSPVGRRRQSRLNSWFGGSSPVRAIKGRVNSLAVGQSERGGSQYSQQQQHHQQGRRHTTTVSHDTSFQLKIPTTNGSSSLFKSDAPGGAVPPASRQTSERQYLQVDGGESFGMFAAGSCNKSDTNINYRGNDDDDNDHQIHLGHNGRGHTDDECLESSIQVPTLNQVQQLQLSPNSPTASTMNTQSSPARTSHLLHARRLTQQPRPSVFVGSHQLARGETMAQSTNNSVRRPRRPAVSLRDLNRKRVKIRFRTRRQVSDRYLAVHEESPQPIDDERDDQATSRQRPDVPDCFIVVYAVNDRDSFEYATLLVSQLRSIKQETPLPIVVVANKIDLERAKVVKSEEGRSLARKNTCKFLEISCTIGFNLDNLLAGIRTQLILKHHFALNSIFKASGNKTSSATNSPSGRPTTGNGGQQAAGKTKVADNILVRFYKRHMMNNNDSSSNYDCDNFSKL